MPEDDRHKLYGLYKQATYGDCTDEKPSGGRNLTKWYVGVRHI